MAVLFSAEFFSVNTITRELLHLAQWNFMWACTLTTAIAPLKI